MFRFPSTVCTDHAVVLFAMWIPFMENNSNLLSLVNRSRVEMMMMTMMMIMRYFDDALRLAFPHLCEDHIWFPLSGEKRSAVPHLVADHPTSSSFFSYSLLLWENRRIPSSNWADVVAADGVCQSKLQRVLLILA